MILTEGCLQRVKRLESERLHSPRDTRGSRTPATKEIDTGYHSGSEEGEIEED